MENIIIVIAVSIVLIILYGRFIILKKSIKLCLR